MNRLSVLALTANFLAISGSLAVADPAYKADDIIKHFAAKPDADLGAKRGLCIGTEAECNAAAAPPAEVARAREAFDLIVTFDYNSDVLTDGAKTNLAEFAKALKDPQLASAAFVVEGHTDARGGEVYNRVLSERRANAVVRYLDQQGVSTANLQAKGYGKAKPRTADPFDAANRRVETRLR